ncbi:MAG TPA: HEAT repeat domain-containing protein [Candidatus Krumholzibacteria bacterium]|nr:HEAT repeat domain-containing protein [Candidatus Krumholzibacteria bacterium]
MIKRHLITLAAGALLGAHALPAHAAGGRYAPLLASTAGQDTLRNLALWEDQRVTDNGRIFEYLRDGSPLVRRRALEAIGRMQEPEDAARVIPSLKDSNPEVFREAVFALGQIGNRDAVQPLLTARAGRGADDVALIADALGKLGGNEAEEALVDMLRDFSSAVRGAAALGLARNRTETAAGGLLLAIHDPDAAVRWKVAYALEKQPTLPRTCQSLQDCLGASEPLVRAYAARSLGKLECHGAEHSLIKLLEDENPGVAVNAVRALGELKSKNAVHPLSAVVMTHKSADVRAAAAEALEKIGEKGARDALMQGLIDPSVLVRTHSVRGLAACMGERSEMFIDEARRDGSRLVRAEAIDCYGRAGIVKRTGELDRIATGDRDPMMRAAAASALGQIKDPAVPSLLPPLLRDPDFTVAAAAVDAIGAQADRTAIPALMEAYYAPRGREFVDVQLAIVRVLGEMGAAEAESLLVEAATHEDYRVRDAAVEALTHMNRTPPDAPGRTFRELSYDRSRRKQLAPPSGTRHAVIATSRGDIEVELFGDDAIQTVANFIDLAKRGFYKDLTIHRVVPNFVIQGGDPRGDGSGDSGYTVPAEVSRHQYGEGYLGIADAGKDTGSCQWFITMSPQPHLSGRYTIFGRVTKGMDVVWKIDRGDTFDVRVTE